MAPENIVRPLNEQIQPDLSSIDLSKVDSYALGIILVNMLTGDYLFESCLTSEYNRMASDAQYLRTVLCLKSPTLFDTTPEVEIEDLVQLL